MSTEPDAPLTPGQQPGVVGEDDWQQDYDMDASPPEIESAFLTLAMFAGLVVFAVGCFVLVGWG